MIKNELLMSASLLILTGVVVYLIFRDRNNKQLKDHVLNLSENHLLMSRKLNTLDSSGGGWGNEGYIPTEAGRDGPLKFMTAFRKEVPVPGVGGVGGWQKVGIIFSQSTSDDTVFNLEQRISPYPGEYPYEYRAVDTDKGISIELPSESNKDLKNGDTFLVPGKDTIGLFVVARDRDYVYVRI
jgi:hypothetical protein